MNGYLLQQYYGYSQVSYQPLFWQAILGVAMDIIILLAMGAWVLSLMKKAFRGEEVELL